ncbi:phosphoadenosine phosphosulfate reductase [Geranomyces variabilis]|nr:phosphoadenosine phosphosulfate reductase [Geranomyces variabilis]KAJ3140733.1 hypothetical protein HDU90_008037 [Geranomyces variabilis]
MAPSIASDPKASSSALTSSSSVKQQHSQPSVSAASIFTAAYLDHLNAQLAGLEPQKIIEWALVSLPGLYQTTAFGLTGLVILDMISKISQERQATAAASPSPPSPASTATASSSAAPAVTADGDSDDSDSASASSSSFASASASTPPSPHLVPLIFIDTLHHFPETLNLATTAAERYSAPLHIYRPAGSLTTADEFASTHGANLWSTDPDSYDYLVKVEPAQRAYAELGVRAVFTGRRRTQRGARSAIPILELDSSAPGVLKVNALAAWDYDAVWAYVRQNNVPYNALIDKGYKSVGDVHSTLPTAPGEGERDGRWKGQEKTECGLHKDYFKMRAQFLAAQKKKAAAAAAAASAEGARTEGLQQAAEAAPVGA